MKTNNVPTRLSLLAGVLAVMWATTGQAITLKEAAQEAVLKNPEVLTRWHSYKAATEEIGVIRGANRPRVDVTAGIARERQDTPTLDDTYTRSQLSLIFNQMLFDGHATRNQVTKFNHAQRVRYFELLDAAETAASEAMRAYVDVLRFRKLHQLAQENYVQHRIVFEQIQQRVKSGVGRRVDLEQASGRLALAESNLLTEASNLHDVSARYQRIVGNLPPAQMDEPPALAEGIPGGADQALRLAYTQHPALAAAQENIIAAQSDAKTRNSAFLPRVDLRARQDFGNDLDGVDGSHKLTNIELLLNYNLYNGGADTAAERQYWEQVNVAKDMRDKACRDIRQTLYIAYNDVNRLREQLSYLEQHQLSIEKARDAYRKQFDIGQRTLLDLLDTENELFEAKRAYQRAYYDHLYAMGRTQAGMGNLVGVMALQRPEAADLVKTEDKAAFDPDAVCPADVPNQLVIDKDKVFAEAMAAAGLTVAPNSAAGAVAPSPAAPAVQADADADGVPDARDRCPETPKGTRVDADGCPYKAVLELKGVTFALNSALIAHAAYAVLDDAARILKANPKVTAEVSGHTDASNSDAFNQRLSERRAEAVMNYLVSQGVSAAQLTAKGYGESQPIADNASEAGMAKNRRVELRVINRL